MTLHKTCTALAALLLAGSALAFPDKTVTIVVPYPAGGAADAAARIVGAKLQAAWGQPVVVENRAGATGAIGTDHVIKSVPDGHTLLIQPAIIVSTELTRPSVNYRVLRDLVAVTGIFTTPIVYLASNTAPPGDLKAILQAGKAGEKLDYASHGDGTMSHYIGESLKKTTGVAMVHVPYAGDNPILTDLLGGHVKTGFLSSLNAKKAVTAGKARMLAVASAARSPLLPDVPTLTEMGITGIDRESWVKLFAPVKTPPAVVEQIARDVSTALRAPDVQEQFLAMGLVPTGGTPAQSLRDLQSDFAFWQRMISDFGTLAK